jgi:hypothetical protein
MIWIISCKIAKYGEIKETREIFVSSITPLVSILEQGIENWD